MSAREIKPGSDMPDDRARHELEIRLATELERLPGVVGAAIWLDDEGAVRDVRITASPATPALIVSNGTAQVLGKHGLTLPPNAMTIVHATGPAPVETPIEAASDARGGRFLILEDITVSRSAGRVTCNVQLGCRGETFAGEAREVDSEAGRIRAACAATLTAAQGVATKVTLGLEGAATASHFGHDYVIVSIEGSAGRRHVTLSGITHYDATRSIEEAACLATLRAIDRWIAW